MSYETRAYDNEHGDPVVVLVADGTHDVGRLAGLLATGNCEQSELGRTVLRQIRQHDGGRAALQMLAAHGGPDLLFGLAPAEGDVAELIQMIHDYGKACVTAGRLLGEGKVDDADRQANVTTARAAAIESRLTGAPIPRYLQGVAS